jgi:uncharacterized protein (TIGR03083 family)
MTDTEIRSAIASQRLELVAILAGLPAPRWDEPTLCAGWRVREVAAHLAMPFRYSIVRFLLDLARAGGNFDRMADRAARRDAAALTTNELVSVLRDNAHNAWKPPGGGYQGALTHDVVHGLDIAVPLGIELPVPEDRLRVVLGGLTTPKGLKYFGVDLAGIQLCADDLDWTFGSGTPLTGTGTDLALLLAGRRLPTGRLGGEPSARFSVR